MILYIKLHTSNISERWISGLKHAASMMKIQRIVSVSSETGSSQPPDWRCLLGREIDVQKSHGNGQS